MRRAIPVFFTGLLIELVDHPVRGVDVFPDALGFLLMGLAALVGIRCGLHRRWAALAAGMYFLDAASALLDVAARVGPWPALARWADILSVSLHPLAVPVLLYAIHRGATHAPQLSWRSRAALKGILAMVVIGIPTMLLVHAAQSEFLAFLLMIPLGAFALCVYLYVLFVLWSARRLEARPAAPPQAP